MKSSVKLSLCGVFLVALIVSLFALPNTLSSPEDRVYINPPHLLGTFCEANFNSGVMTDTSCLQFKTETEGVITINDNRYLAFGLTGTAGGQNFKNTSMDFEWVWSPPEETSEYYKFVADNNNPNFIWRQYYYFYKDPAKPMKIKHYLENNWQDITNAKMYYLTNVYSDDVIGFNNTEFLVSDNMGLHEQGDFNTLPALINFDEGYNFLFGDIIDNGFTVNEFYIGSGSVIGKPAIDIMAVGFTKNNGNFPLGASVWVDPTFTTENVESGSIAPLDTDTFVIAWCDETADDIEFKIYDTDGTLVGSQVTVDSAVSTCDTYSVDVSVLNSTHFVVAYSDIPVADVSFLIYNSTGSQMLGITDVDTSTSATSTVSVSTLNSTHFVVAYEQGTADNVSFAIHNSTGDQVLGITTVDGDAGDNTVSVSAFNETHFVIGWYDDTDNDASFAIYDSDGNSVVGITDIDTDVTFSYSVMVATFNSTHFVVGYYDDTDEDISFAIYKLGTQTVSEVDVDTGSGDSYSTSVSTLNSTHFVIGWWDEVDTATSFAVYDSEGNVVVSATNSSATAQKFFVSVSSQEVTSGIGLCGDGFIQGFAKNTTYANWTAYYPNGSVWAGDCPDSTPPVITLDAPTNGTYYTTVPYINGTVVEANLDSIVTNHTSYTTKDTSSPFNFTNTTALTEGKHDVLITANDTVGNEDTDAVWFYFDPSAPTATFGDDPVDVYNSSSQSITFEVKCADDVDINSTEIWGNWTGTWHANVTNSTPTNNSWWNKSINNIAEGTWRWSIRCNDSAGNVDWTNTNRTFTVDLTAPIITVISPTNTTYDTTWRYTNISAPEYLSYCNYSLNDTGNTTMTRLNSSYFYANVSVFTDGNYNITFSCNDSVGWVNSSVGYTYFTIDLTDPVVLVDTPANGTYFNYIPHINGTVTEVNLDTIKTNDSNYTTLDTSSPFNFTNTSIPDGTYQILITANDTTNHLGTNAVYFYYDTVTPTLTFYTSQSNGTTSVGSINITVNASETMNESILEWNCSDTSTATNYTMTVHANISFRQIIGLLNNVRCVYKVYANDSASNLGKTVTRYVTHIQTEVEGGSGGGGGGGSPSPPPSGEIPEVVISVSPTSFVNDIEPRAVYSNAMTINTSNPLAVRVYLKCENNTGCEWTNFIYRDELYKLFNLNMSQNSSETFTVRVNVPDLLPDDQYERTFYIVVDYVSDIILIPYRLRSQTVLVNPTQITRDLVPLTKHEMQLVVTAIKTTDINMRIECIDDDSCTWATFVSNGIIKDEIDASLPEGSVNPFTLSVQIPELTEEEMFQHQFYIVVSSPKGELKRIPFVLRVPMGSLNEILADFNGLLNAKIPFPNEGINITWKEILGGLLIVVMVVASITLIKNTKKPRRSKYE